MPEIIDSEREWLLTNGSGAFALGCVDRIPRRKYHSLFSLADGLGPESTSRNLVMDIVEFASGGVEATLPLANPRGGTRQVAELLEFVHEPSPRWTYDLGWARLVRILEMPSAAQSPMPHAARSSLRVRYALEPSNNAPAKPLRLSFEPWMLSRPLHVEMKLNTALWGTPLPGSTRGTWRFQMYPNEPILRLSWTGISPDWDQHGRWEPELSHGWEAERGYNSTEDVFIPGLFHWHWDGHSKQEFSLTIEWEHHAPLFVPEEPAPAVANASDFKSRLARAATAYTASIREHEALTPTLLAGLPWFGPWGRDTLISLPGYALATRRADQSYAILAAMGLRIREALRLGHLGGPGATHRGPEAVNLHGVDTPLLFVWATERLDRYGLQGTVQLGVLREIAYDIVTLIAQGAYPGMEILADGRVRLQKGPWAPTWMDARIESQPVTPRHGEPIEINALFAHALSYLADHQEETTELPPALRAAAAVAPKTVADRYWRAELGHFADTIDDGPSGNLLRPNQLWLLALPRLTVERDQARSALATLCQQLLTPLGLRTLAPSAADYRGRCEGNQRARDEAYHQGTVWPWLLGLLGDALIRFEGLEAARATLAPVLAHLEKHLLHEGCIGQISEIFDGDQPHAARGAPAQAWSVMELYRLVEELKQ